MRPCVWQHRRQGDKGAFDEGLAFSVGACHGAWRGGVHCHFCGNSGSNGCADERCSRCEFHRRRQENRGSIYKKNAPSRDTSPGQLYTQITQHAPFPVFLSADEERAQRAVDDGFAVANSRFTFAIGKIVLWSKNPRLVTGPETLEKPTFRKIAIANPAAAPYGLAAIEAMKALGVYETLQPKIVQGNSIAQTYQFIDTGNAELGFVALAQIVGHAGGSRWPVPEKLYTPIRQDAVLLKTGEHAEAALAFLAFLKGPEATRIIQSFGYGTVAD
jgi:molybdate transport system substrate-binding protein